MSASLTSEEPPGFVNSKALFQYGLLTHTATYVKPFIIHSSASYPGKTPG